VSPTGIQYKSNLQSRLPICGQTVFNAEPDYRMLVMAYPPRVHNLVLVVVKYRMTFVPMVLVPLCECRAADERRKHHGKDRC
jgi:hypothetical protein